MTRRLRITPFVLAIYLLGITAAFLLTATAAQAQTACGSRDVIVEKLDEKYGERRRGGGLSGPKGLIEIWASEETGTWTILKTTPNGLTCVMALGTAWQDDVVVERVAGEGA